MRERLRSSSDPLQTTVATENSEVYFTTESTPQVNALTVDVEDFYQVSAFDPYISRSDWDSYENRVGLYTNQILNSFATANVKGTFFVLGYVAKGHKDLVRRIVDEGHELASHGWCHHRVSEQTPDEFFHDVCKTKALLQDLSGVEVKGYRAPSYSITNNSLWAHEVLKNADYTYSSSIAPIKHDHYGIPTAPRFAFRVEQCGLIEVPISTVNVMGSNYPCGGGGWFRLYPYNLSKWALKRIVEHDQHPCVFYFHPWEIDPDQPRIEGLGRMTRFRHYVNLNTMEAKIQSLLSDFNWGRMDDIFLPTSLTLPAMKLEQ